MGVDTKGYLNKKVTGKEIYNVITTKFDKDAEYDIDHYDDNNTEMGRIFFKDGTDGRGIFYCISEDKTSGTEYADGRRHVTLIMGCWGNSAYIMTEIVKCFGGYVDENDCDGIDAYYVPKDESFKYDDYVRLRKEIEDSLSDYLDVDIKINIANQIVKHKDNILKILNEEKILNDK